MGLYGAVQFALFLLTAANRWTALYGACAYFQPWETLVLRNTGQRLKGLTVAGMTMLH
jgi:hypothetical protein